MTPEAREIFGNLERVAKERASRESDQTLLAGTLAVKRYQRARFEKTYGDLLVEPRYRAAARFFLEELYGPQDFRERDAQFARIVSPLVGMFPQEVVITVLALSELHALSEELDTRMGRALSGTALNGSAYALGWQSVGRAPDRRHQFELLAAVGHALDGYTRNPLLRQALRLMRGPARAAGLGALQRFLESGFESFRSMGGASRF
ncbi:MAG: hypothetical protein KGI35_02295, partial [Burkholderiales bacterium]|nr:hypothetical protein [Burkholderiales bacterium]